jgi:maltose-binding protein MalE
LGYRDEKMRRGGFMFKRKIPVILFIIFLSANVGCDDIKYNSIRNIFNSVPEYNEEQDELEYGDLTVAIPASSSSQKDYFDSIIEELNNITLNAINTKVKFIYMSQSHLSYETHYQLSSGNCDIVLCQNGSLGYSSDTSLPYFVSQGLIKDITEMLPVYAPEMNEMFHSVNYFDYMKINDRIYRIPYYIPVSDMPIAVIRKELLEDNGIQDIDTLDDIYTLLVNSELKGKKYYFCCDYGWSANNAIDFFVNINDYLTIPFITTQSGYLYDPKNNHIVKFEDTPVLEQLRNFYYYYDLYGIDSFYHEAVNNNNVGIILEKAYYCLIQPVDSNAFKYFLLYKSKKFESFHYVPLWVISAASHKSERSLIFLNYLFNNMDANLLASYGIENRNYKIGNNGVLVNIKPASLMRICNPKYILPTWPDPTSFREIFDLYHRSVFAQDRLLDLYNDYDLLKEYIRIIESKDAHVFTERKEALRPYTLTMGKEEKIQAFNDMLQALEKIGDENPELLVILESFMNGAALAGYGE